MGPDSRRPPVEHRRRNVPSTPTNSPPVVVTYPHTGGDAAGAAVGRPGPRGSITLFGLFLLARAVPLHGAVGGVRGRLDCASR
ncbi:hypothetical protein GCM10009864_16590 [Streptomyces lunalinharesii]|uniref:Uncharacterized protein n=1 Tax=Streptomyces lunalinharesii TaxID=333384 RepID=A0ABP6DVL8_9ACTN